MKMRIGVGYDTHRLVKGRKLVIGCVEMPYFLGLVGHSDADVLAHAIADSIFGALGLPDIGQQFPDDVRWTKDLDSKIILRHAADQVRQHGCIISNIDSVIITQSPKLAEYISAMQISMSDILKIHPNAIGIKSKTNDGICAIGSGKAIAAISNCLLMEQLYFFLKKNIEIRRIYSCDAAFDGRCFESSLCVYRHIMYHMSFHL